MIIMGTNTWESDMPKDILVTQALKFAEDVKSKGIAELRDFLMATDQKVLWCTWETENLKALEAAFAEMNKQSGLISELTPVENMYPK
jgi:hypothetical protein